MDNASRYNGTDSQIAKDSEILKKRLFDEIEKLSNKFEENKNNINNDIANDSTIKKLNGKKRKRVLTNLDLDQDIFKLDDNDQSEDYLYGNHKRRELRSSNRLNNINNIIGNKNSINSISIDINNNNKNAPSIKKKPKKKRK